MHWLKAVIALLFINALSISGSPMTIEEILSTHCVDCHGNAKSKGGLNLQKLSRDIPFVKHRETWEHVIELVKIGEMPPEEETHLSGSERKQLLDLLEESILHFDYSSIDHPGFEQTRRLSKNEYLNTLRDLLGVSKLPDLKFPDELTGASGFDNSSNTLFLQSSLMSRYISTAERVITDYIPIVPKTADQIKAHKRIFIARPSETVSPHQAATLILQDFLSKAYRRPVTSTELENYLELFSSSDEDKATWKGFVQAIRPCLQAALISPKFIFRSETEQDTLESYRISSFELASRLSYFLWTSMPDEELFLEAKKGTLHQPQILKHQIQRMLRDPKSDTLGSQFLAQWLGFGLLGNRIRLDPIDNPWCTDTLMESMRNETAMMFVSLIRNNHPIEDMIIAPFTFMNEELANEIYKLDSVKGSSMRRVSLKDPNRIGLLTHGSLMAITSNYKETSPIKRGNWILETLLGKPLPPPPPNAGSLSDELEEDDSLTFQQKVELHSKSAQCRSCHSKMDPFGFSLENFDYFGRWRSHYRVRMPNRENHYARKLAESVRGMNPNELLERLHDLDINLEEKLWLRNQISLLRKLTETALKTYIHTTITDEDQVRLIQLLEEMDIEPSESEDGWIQSVREGFIRFKQLNSSELLEKLTETDADLEERKTISESAVWASRLTLRSLDLLLKQDREEELERLVETLDVLDLIEWEEDDENEEDQLQLVSISGKTELADGTQFQGPSGLRDVLLKYHRDDIARQLIRKMLSYALGRQLEYFDEKAVESILSKTKKKGYRFEPLIEEIASSYPFQYKKNPDLKP